MENFDKLIKKREENYADLKSQWDFLEDHIGEVFAKYKSHFWPSFGYYETWSLENNSIVFYNSDYDYLSVPTNFFVDFDSALEEANAKKENQKRIYAEKLVLLKEAELERAKENLKKHLDN